MLKSRFLLISVVTLLFGVCHAQEPDTLNKQRLKRFIGLSALGYGVTMTALGQIWYRDFDKQPFQFFDDSREWYQADKIGHSFAGYHLTGFVFGELTRCHVSGKRAMHLAALSSFLAVSSIEIFDGRSAGYGASASDLAANAAGTLLFWGQQQAWQEQRVRIKFSFHPTDYAPLRPSLLGENLMEEIVKDYNGQTYWLSIDLDKFMRFPKWLNIAPGYGVEDFLYANVDSNISSGYSPHRQYYLGLDFDLSGIRTQSRLVKTLLTGLSAIRLPAPALAYGNGRWQFHPLYF